MPIKNFDPTPASNLSSNGISIAENCAFANWNNWARQTQADLRNEIANVGANVASAAGPTLDVDGAVVTVTGTTTVVGWATAVTGLARTVYYETATPHTNSSALKCPAGANFTSAKGDVLRWRSFGAGNWAVEHTQLASGGVVGAPISLTVATGSTVITVTSQDPGASGPRIRFNHDSPSPADGDVAGFFDFLADDDGGASDTIAQFQVSYDDVTATTEDASFLFRVMQAGTRQTEMTVGLGVGVGPTATLKGTGTVSALNGLYVGGHGTIAQVVRDTEATYTTLGTIMPADDTIPQNTEGDEILSVAITPINASSTLEIDVSLQLGHGAAGGQCCAAIFVDTTADAISAAAMTVTNTSTSDRLHWIHSLSAGSTSARTYKVRAGSAVATDAKLNGDNTARFFGGVCVSSLTVREILPQ